MKVLVSRVTRAEIEVRGERIASIPRGLAVYVGFCRGDGAQQVYEIAKKLIHLRIFEDERQKMRFSAAEINGHILCVPNFTLCADTRSGRRPSFEGALAPDRARLLFRDLLALLQTELPCAAGIFGADMRITQELDGPVNLVLESRSRGGEPQKKGRK
ncbi:MAG: D-tyrosyl-tRNA(Tyr) deacylase [Candidatus Omnitrophica bacterium]|nr:D-tyrosyl-tRNA(Tyr) deacylase [Candidatus Omnitrophota bacterium]